MASQGFSKEDIERMGNSVDQLVSLDVGGRMVLTLLYQYVRERQARPSCLLAAEKLAERLGHGDFVLIT